MSWVALLATTGIKFWDPVEDSDTGDPSSLIVKMEYIFAFQCWYCELCVENRWRGGRKHLFCLFLFFGCAWIVGGWGVVGWGRNSHLGSAEIASFSSRDFSQSNKHDAFWPVVSTGYFCVLFLWTIAISDFCPLGICKNLDLPLSTNIFIVNSRADNHFYKYIFVSNVIQFEVSFIN